MSRIVIQAEHLSKHYRLGTIGYGSLKHDLQSWWARVRGQEDPNQVLGAKLADKQDFWALQDVNFEIEEGDRVGIIGRNGAGKSTLLKILSRVTAPTSGLVKVRGRIASLLEVGTGFHPELTGRENIYLNGAILGMKKAEITKNLDAIVDFSGVAQFLDTPVKRYSSGMYVRLAFAVAAHLEPDILIVDEVLAVGDAEFQKKCLGKMEDVSKNQGRTVLFVSHNMEAIQNLCNKGILLQRGALHTKGLIEKALDSYRKIVQSNFEKDLSKRQDREGKGELIVDNLSISNARDNEGSTIEIGDCLKINVKLTNKNEKALRDIRMSISVSDEKGRSLINLSNYYEGKLINSKEKEIQLICTTEAISLNAGKYSLNYYLEANSELQDSMENATVFIIEPTDFFGSGRIAESSFPLLLRSAWTNPSF